MYLPDASTLVFVEGAVVYTITTTVLAQSEHILLEYQYVDAIAQVGERRRGGAMRGQTELKEPYLRALILTRIWYAHGSALPARVGWCVLPR